MESLHLMLHLSFILGTKNSVIVWYLIDLQTKFNCWNVVASSLFIFTSIHHRNINFLLMALIAKQAAAAPAKDNTPSTDEEEEMNLVA